MVFDKAYACFRDFQATYEASRDLIYADTENIDDVLYKNPLTDNVLYKDPVSSSSDSSYSVSASASDVHGDLEVLRTTSLRDRLKVELNHMRNKQYHQFQYMQHLSDSIATSAREQADRDCPFHVLPFSNLHSHTTSHDFYLHLHLTLDQMAVLKFQLQQRTKQIEALHRAITTD